MVVKSQLVKQEIEGLNERLRKLELIIQDLALEYVKLKEEVNFLKNVGKELGARVSANWVKLGIWKRLIPELERELRDEKTRFILLKTHFDEVWREVWERKDEIDRVISKETLFSGLELFKSVLDLAKELKKP